MDWMLWLFTALILVLVDVILFGGASGILLALGIMALIGMVCALAGISWEWQILSAALSGFIIVPVALKILRRTTPGQLLHGVEDPRIRGRSFQIHIDSTGKPRINVLGDSYPVRMEDGNGGLESGSAVNIVRFEGVTAVVRPAARTGTYDSKNTD
ncbi:protein of unknown function DUF107 [Desulfonatronospira thiodismutans ASO3-1]|uniref:Uncharacterized protein n=1 Tax=Desulfonatronospira thiodismutans ASO3-1 TaxID=555779 RepID=D6SMY2_9BACT|nr:MULTISPECIES: NfeD family protein [Desulfonatronospira]EFI36043.1 protein of unknown function DUF107 [Desulfonatronospira thiodismutans ASO3-1]